MQSNHFHMLVEVTDREALTRGAKGMLVRLAKQLNRLWGRDGQVFPDRYHVRELTTPTEVRRAPAYVLHNARRHGAFGRGIDPFSSGRWFDGFAERPPRLGDARDNAVLVSLQSQRAAPRATVLEQMRQRPRATCRAQSL